MRLPWLLSWAPLQTKACHVRHLQSHSLQAKAVFDYHSWLRSLRQNQDLPLPSSTGHHKVALLSCRSSWARLIATFEAIVLLEKIFRHPLLIRCSGLPCFNPYFKEPAIVAKEATRCYRDPSEPFWTLSQLFVELCRLSFRFLSLGAHLTWRVLFETFRQISDYGHCFLATRSIFLSYH